MSLSLIAIGISISAICDSIDDHDCSNQAGYLDLDIIPKLFVLCVGTWPQPRTRLMLSTYQMMVWISKMDGSVVGYISPKCPRKNEYIS